MNTKVFDQTIKNREEIDDTFRGIPAEVYALYDVCVDTKRSSDGAFVFPLMRNNNVVGYKCRNVSFKKFWCEGDTSPLFGSHVVPSYDALVITEGEFDAMAAYHMLEGQAACVSIAHGASGVKKDIEANLSFIKKFSDVYLCFDNDEAGQKGLEQAVSLLPNAYVIDLGDYKDPNEILEKGDITYFQEAITNAQPAAKVVKPAQVETKTGDVDQRALSLPSELLGFSAAEIAREVKEAHKDPRYRKGVSFGIPALDACTGGAKPGEIKIFVGETGCGKTTLVRSMAHNLMLRDQKVMWLSLEMPRFRLLELFVENYHRRDYDELTPEQIDEATQWLGQRLYINDSLTLRNAEDFATWLAAVKLQLGVDAVVIDHLSLLIADKRDWLETERFLMTINDTCIRHRLAILAVAQFGKDKDIKGSSGINQISSATVRIDRKYNSPVSKITLMKPYRYAKDSTLFTEFYLKYDPDSRTYEEIPEDEANVINTQASTSRGESVKERFQRKLKERARATYEELKAQRRAEAAAENTSNQVLEETTSHTVEDNTSVLDGDVQDQADVSDTVPNTPVEEVDPPLTQAQAFLQRLQERRKQQEQQRVTKVNESLERIRAMKKAKPDPKKEAREIYEKLKAQRRAEYAQRLAEQAAAQQASAENTQDTQPVPKEETTATQDTTNETLSLEPEPTQEIQPVAEDTTGEKTSDMETTTNDQETSEETENKEDQSTEQSGTTAPEVSEPLGEANQAPEEPVRESSSGTESPSEDDLRRERAILDSYTQIYAGFLDYIKERQDHLHRGEGVFKVLRPGQTPEDFRAESLARLAAFAREIEQINKSTKKDNVR